MATTSNIAVTQGSGKNPATYSFTEDAITKDIARAVLSNPLGADINPANPLAISWLGSTASTVGQKTMANSVPIVVASDQTTINIFIPDTGHTLGSVGINGVSTANTLSIFIPDTGHTLGNVGINSVNTANTLSIFIPDTSHTLGNIGSVNSITTTVNVQLDPGHTIGALMPNQSVNINQYGGTGTTIGSKVAASSMPVAIATDQINAGIQSDALDMGTSPFQRVNGMTMLYNGSTWDRMRSSSGTGSTGILLVNLQSTINVPFTASGSASGVSVSGNTVVSPSASYNFKVYAYSLTSTLQSSVTAKFTNGAGTSPTEYWRVALQAPANVASGANFGVTPPSFLFATGTNTTLALVLDSASLVHYSVAYFKESA